MGDPPTAVSIENKIFASSASGAAVYELNPSTMSWNWQFNFGGYYGTPRRNFQMFNWKDRLYMGWLEDKPNTYLTDVRLVQKTGENLTWLDGGKPNSEINFSQTALHGLSFVFVNNKIYSAFRDSGNVYRAKVYKDGKWNTFSENLNRGNSFMFVGGGFLKGEDFPLFLMFGFPQSKLFLTAFFDELEESAQK